MRKENGGNPRLIVDHLPLGEPDRRIEPLVQVDQLQALSFDRHLGRSCQSNSPLKLRALFASALDTFPPASPLGRLRRERGLRGTAGLFETRLQRVEEIDNLCWLPWYAR